MEYKNHITIFGATGKIGGELIELLSQAEIETVAVTRNLAKANQLPFINWIEADMADKESLGIVMRNSKSVFLLSGSSVGFVTEQKNVIDVARELAINYIVKLSSGAADKHSTFHIPRSHGDVEDYLISSGIHYTMLRPYGIMQNWLGEIAGSIRNDRKFCEATGSGKRAHVDRRDIAEVAFKCLTEPWIHYDSIYLLTSDKAVDYFEIAQAISKEIDEDVEYVPISIETARQQMKQQGMLDEFIETFISYDTAQRNGETEIVTDCVRNILGKPARSLENFVKDYRVHFI